MLYDNPESLIADEKCVSNICSKSVHGEYEFLIKHYQNKIEKPIFSFITDFGICLVI